VLLLAERSSVGLSFLKLGAASKLINPVSNAGMRRVLLIATFYPALFLFLVLVTQVPASARGQIQILETHDAIIIHSKANAALAIKTAEIMAFAVHAVGEDFGQPQHPVTVYIYETAEEMSDGLVRSLGFDRISADTIARVGISMRSRDTLHIHQRTGGWGDMFWYAVVHEHAHGMVEDRYGPGIAEKARWIYEGLGDYSANRALYTKFPDAMNKHTERMGRLAFKALVLGNLPRLANISTKQQWEANIRRGREPWNTQYAAAIVAVRYAVGKYGLNKVKDVLDQTGSGTPYQKAIQEVFGVSLLIFEARYMADLFLKGAFDLYARYTLLVAGCMLSLIIILWLAFFWRRRIEAAANVG